MKRSNHWKNLYSHKPGCGQCKDVACRPLSGQQSGRKSTSLVAYVLFDDTTVEVSSKLIILGSYNAELNQNKVKKHL